MSSSSPQTMTRGIIVSWISCMIHHVVALVAENFSVLGKTNGQSWVKELENGSVVGWNRHNDCQSSWMCKGIGMHQSLATACAAAPQGNKAKSIQRYHSTKSSHVRKHVNNVAITELSARWETTGRSSTHLFNGWSIVSRHLFSSRPSSMRSCARRWNVLLFEQQTLYHVQNISICLMIYLSQIQATSWCTAALQQTD